MILSHTNAGNEVREASSSIISIFILRDGGGPAAAGAYLITDNVKELRIQATDNSTPVQERSDTTISESAHFTATDNDGNTIGFTITSSENGLIIHPEGETAKRMCLARPDLVLGLALVELQELPDFQIGGITTVYFKVDQGPDPAI